MSDVAEHSCQAAVVEPYEAAVGAGPSCFRCPQVQHTRYLVTGPSTVAVGTGASPALKLAALVCDANDTAVPPSWFHGCKVTDGFRSLSEAYLEPEHLLQAISLGLLPGLAQD